MNAIKFSVEEIQRRLKKAQEPGRADQNATSVPPDLHKELTSILASSHDCFFLLNRRYEVAFCNQAAETSCRRDKRGIIGSSFLALFPSLRTILKPASNAGDKPALPDKPLEMCEEKRWYEFKFYPADAFILALVQDITRRKLDEEGQVFYERILSILNRSSNWQQIIQHLLNEFKEFTGFDAIGIRMKEDQHYPYVMTDGFSSEFLKNEACICARDEDGNLIKDMDGNVYLECMCGTVINGETNPALPFFTEGGSFWTNSTTKLLRDVNRKERRHWSRFSFYEAGYESVALIPIRVGNEIIGLLQFNDGRTDCLTPETVAFFEKIACRIGHTYLRERAVNNRQDDQEKYHQLFEQSGEIILLVDTAGYLLDANQQATHLLGYTKSELIGRSLHDLYTSNLSTSTLRSFSHAQKEGQGCFATGFMSAGGDTIPVEVTVNTITFKDGQAFECIVQPFE